MYTASPRVELRLLRAIARIDDPSLPIAETHRRIRQVADELGIPRPSYERVRQHVRHVRRQQVRRRRNRQIVIGVATYTRPVHDLAKLVE